MLTTHTPQGVVVSPLGLVDVPNLLALLGGRSRSWLYSVIKNAPTFPELFKIAGRRHARYTDVLVWVDRKTREAA